MLGCDGVYVRYNSHVPKKISCTRECGDQGRITLNLKPFLSLFTKQPMRNATQVCTDFKNLGDVVIKQSHFSAAPI